MVFAVQVIKALLFISFELFLVFLSQFLELCVSQCFLFERLLEAFFFECLLVFQYLIVHGNLLFQVDFLFFFIFFELLFNSNLLA
jgi:hypothetical protein